MKKEVIHLSKKMKCSSEKHADFTTKDTVIKIQPVRSSEKLELFGNMFAVKDMIVNFAQRVSVRDVQLKSP